ncbi:RHS repeat-associated core domain-containing protein [Halocola ammonii]
MNYYSWSVQGGSIIGASDQSSVDVEWTSEGTFSLSAEAFDSNDQLIDQGSIQINTFDDIQPSLTVTDIPPICGGSSLVSFEIAQPDPDATSFQWALPNGVTLDPQSTDVNAYLNFDDYPSAGAIEITPVYPAGSGTTASYPLTYVVLPDPANPIDGPQSVCSQSTFETFSSVASANAAEYEWEITGVFNTTTTEPTITIDIASITGLTSGLYTVTLTPVNNCGSSASSSIDFYVNDYTDESILEDMVTDNEILNGVMPGLTINHCEDQGLPNCEGVSKEFDRAILYATVDLGEVFNFGAAEINSTNQFSKHIELEIRAYNGPDNTSTQIATYDVVFDIDNFNPEQVFQVDISDIYLDIFHIEAEVDLSSYSAPGVVPIEDELRLDLFVEPEYRIGQIDNSQLLTIGEETAEGNGRYTFDWSSICDLEFPNYEFQIMRLYNSGQDQNLDPVHPYPSTMDWDAALSIETQSPEKSLTITIAEGSGVYAWRVRPIGNLYEGGIANSRNYGEWTAFYTYDNTAVDPTQANDGLGDLDGLDEDRNWIYSRVFTEGSYREGQGFKTREEVVYANGLNQATQSQRHLQSNDDYIVATQTVYDFSGRPTLQSMPVPINTDGLGYQSQLLKSTESDGQGGTTDVPYGPEHFDENSNYKEPSAVAASTEFETYYSSSDNDGIPGSEGYPYTRTLYYPDGSGRVKEQSGVGETFRLKDEAGRKTSKTYYSSVTDSELYRVFGDEAPLGQSVQKVITIDPNNSGNVTYIDKEGRTIATCLTIVEPQTNTLEPLDSQAEAEFSVVQSVNGDTPLDEYSSIASSEITLAEPTALTIDYSLTAASITPCLGGGDCSYEIHFEIYNVEEPEINLFPEGPVYTCSGGTCNPQLPSSVTTPDQLEPGTYIISRTIYSNTTPPGASQSTLADMLDGAETTIEGLFQTELFDLLDDYLAGTGTSQDLNMDGVIDIHDFYEDINGGPLSENQEYVTVEFNGVECSDVQIPVFDICDTESIYPLECDPVDYTNFLTSNLEGDWSDYCPNYLPNEFQDLLTNMLDPAKGNYECEDLWECWTGLVQGAPALAGLYDSEELEVSMSVDLVPMFLECTGYKFTGMTSSDYAGTGLDSNEALAYGLAEVGPVFYEDYNLDNGTETLDCVGLGEDASMEEICACSIIETSNNEDPNETGLSPVSSLAQFGNQHWFNFNQCVRGAEAGQNSSVVPDNQMAVDTAEEIQTECESLCQSREESFRSELLNLYHANNIYVEGMDDYLTEQDPYTENYVSTGVSITQQNWFDWSQPGGTYDVIQDEDLQCAVMGLIDHCEASCVIEVQYDPPGSNIIESVGTPTQIESVQSAMLAQYELSLPTGPGSCASGYTLVDETVLETDPAPVEYEMHDFYNFEPNPILYDHVFTVNSTDDAITPETCNCHVPWVSSGTCTLRDAILMANEINEGENALIIFDFDGFQNEEESNQSFTIELLSALPSIERAVCIDAGTSSGNYLGTDRRIKLVGQGTSSFDCFEFQQKSEVSGFEFEDFDYAINSWTGIDVYDNIFHDCERAINIDDAQATSIPERAEDGVIYGNIIGGTELIPNPAVNTNIQIGIYLSSTVAHYQVGGLEVGMANTLCGVHQVGIQSYGRHGFNRNRIIKSDDASQFTFLPIYSDLDENQPGNPDVDITGATSAGIFGTAEPGSMIEVFLSSLDATLNVDRKAEKYLGSTMADANGDWTFQTMVQDGNRYVATSSLGTNPQFTTSELCNSYEAVIPPCDFEVCFKWLPVDQLPNFDQGPPIEPLPCEEILEGQLLTAIGELQYEMIEEAQEDIEYQYMNQCANPQNVSDNLTVSYSLGYHHYTLYYYDRAGNLIKTVPPEGVDLMDQGELDAMDRTVHPNHEMVTEYYYNSLGQMVRQETPDGGETYFFYNDDGQLRFSQNAKQLADEKYSYTKYDALGRIVEVGEADALAPGLIAPTDQQLNNNAYPTNLEDCDQQVYTVYTTPANEVIYLNGSPQRNLQNRVSYTYTYEGFYTYYSYDPHGNVEWLVQDFPKLGKQYIGYEYDLVSGNVLKVAYNEGRADQFYHRYSYDADDRISYVETSDDGVIWEKDARYDYYDHGPLKRTVLGEDLVQGTDYTYTLQGWLKAMNHHSLDESIDPGGDNLNNSEVARDAFGMTLTYFDGDFAETNSPFSSSHNQALAGAHDLYNGNISSWAFRAGVEGSTDTWESAPSGFQYRYDELNRLVRSNYHTFSGSSWQANPSYLSEYEYDANGNLQSLYRNSPNGIMDDLNYTYNSTNSNRLDNVSESGVLDVTPNTSSDFEGESDYQYDEIGNLTSETHFQSDEDENNPSLVNNEYTFIEWTVSGKVKRVSKQKPLMYQEYTEILNFYYNSNGERIAKERILPLDQDTTVTYYVRDAQGNIMSVYHKNQEDLPDGYEDVYRLLEQPVYGSSRVGQKKSDLEMWRTFYPDEETESPFSYVTEDRVFISEYEHFPIIGQWDDGTNTEETQLFEVDLAGTSTTAQEAIAIPWGEAGKNTCVAEDRDGNVVLRFTTMNQYSEPPYNLFSESRLYNANGDVVANSENISSDWRGKSMLTKTPGANKLYYLFTFSLAGLPYYHVIDMSANNGSGAVISKNNILDTEGDYVQGTMALIEDHSGYGTGRLFMKRQEGGQTQLISFVIGEQSLTKQVIDEFITTAVSPGEIQLSADGRKLAVANCNWLASGQPTTGELRVYALDVAHDVTGSTLFIDVPPSDELRVESMSFSPEGKWLYYSGTAVGTNTSVEGIYRVGLATTNDGTREQVMLTPGEVRRGKDGKMYVYLSTTTNHDLEIIPSPDATNLPSFQQVNLNLGSDVTFTGNLPPQPIRIYPVENNIYTRDITDNKVYELTDHLGNVRATISDIKVAEYTTGPYTNTGYKADLQSKNSYYPGGSLMPGKSFNETSYRFGFNGKEKDDEISGSGNSYDFGARIYDARISRWLSVDAYWKSYPSHSPYNFALDNPINNIDPDGNIVIPWAYKNWLLGYSWWSYPDFTENSHGKDFANTFIHLYTEKSTDIFAKVYNQLERSNNYYRFKESHFTPDDRNVSGRFELNHKGSKDDPYVIRLFYYPELSVYGANRTSPIFEEVFHAGQLDYYGAEDAGGKTLLQIEVEAKVAKAYAGAADRGYEKDFQDDPVVQQFFDKVKEGDSVSWNLQIAFYQKLDEFVNEVYDLYDENWLKKYGEKFLKENSPENYNLFEGLDYFYFLTAPNIQEGAEVKPEE